MRKLHVIPMAILTTAILAACDQPVQPKVAEPAIVSTEQNIDLAALEGRWILIQKGDQHFRGEDQPTLVIQHQDISGNDGCNQFTGAYDLSGDHLTTQLVNTEKLCNKDQNALSVEFQKLLADSRLSLQGEDIMLSAATQQWLFRQQVDLDNANDSEGHGPDAGSLESIGALVWQGKLETAVKEAFWLAAQDSHPVPLSTIRMSDDSATYISSKPSLDTLSTALYTGVKSKKADLTPEEWLELWALAPEQGTLTDWLNFMIDILEGKSEVLDDNTNLLEDDNAAVEADSQSEE